MPALHDYECTRCGEWTEHTTPMDHRPASFRCACGGKAEWRPCAPAVHTLATHIASIDDPMVRRSSMAGTGDYLDPNLGFDRKTGKHTPITSKAQRERLMRDAGLFQHDSTTISDRARDADSMKRRKPKTFSGVGSRS